MLNHDLIKCFFMGVVGIDISIINYSLTRRETRGIHHLLPS